MDTTGTVLETKLFVPTPRKGLVVRPRLTDRLTREGTRLVLVSAPAGFGKTTLLSTWLGGPDARAGAVAWVSLDAGDRSPATFWTYVASALDRAVPGVAAGTLSLLHPGREPTLDVLERLLNELSALPGEVTLVLDDYHLADGPAIREGMTFLLDHLPPQVRVAIGTRADPALPLARLRARGELVELRAADLRFTGEEVTAYLNDLAGLDLTARELATLEERTEGWAAALQLAALSLRGRADTSDFIAGFAGDDRFVVDYLVEEVLERQPEEVRGFLLETSVLDRLTGSLCDAVTGRGDGRQMLDRLDHGNVFLVPLDDRRRWFRYHHLFRDLLLARLLDERPAVADLHRRASRWHEQAGQPEPAVRHALAAGDVDRAADLVEVAVPELRRHRQEATLRKWVGEFPDHVLARRPVLAMGLVGALMASNDYEDVERRLAGIEQSLRDGSPGVDGTTGDGPALVVLDTAELARLPGCLELYRAALALLGGDSSATLDHARLAADLAPASDDLTRASAAALVGLASLTVGDLDAAYDAYAAAADGLRRLGYLSDVLGCTITLGDIDITCGRLREARRAFEAALELVPADSPRLRGVADMHTGLARVALERADLEEASRQLALADALGDEAALAQNPYRWRVQLARLHEAEGDPDRALALLNEAEQVYSADFQPDARPVAATRARLLAVHGRLEDALDWVRARGLAVGDDLSYLREYEHLTLARVLLARHTADPTSQALADATSLLRRLLTAAEEAGRHGIGIEVLTLLALAHQAAGEHADALAALERALGLAEPEGFARVFLIEGEPMARLLTAMARRRPGWPFLRHLLQITRVTDQAATDEAGPVRQDHGVLVQPLTERERDVLRLLGSELDGPGIARELVLSLNTVRTHTKNIYTKLGVTNRRAALSRARDLGLLPHAATR